MMLFPSCSEYTTRIHLSPKEKVKAKELIKIMKLEEDDDKILKEYLDEDNSHGLFGKFTQDVLLAPYEQIKEMINIDRKKKLSDAILAQKITKEEAEEILAGLVDGKTYMDVELDEILEDYHKYKDFITKVKILDNLENSDKKYKWDTQK
jgi:hypothetical protein